MGDELPGARGATVADQDRIDVTLARACAAGLYTRQACDLHTRVSAEARRDFSRAGAPPTS